MGTSRLPTGFPFIAAHARSLGLTLVTNNPREFGRVSKLVIESWAV
ncbi:MAG: hypothetical protein WAK62_14755 [Terriglobales bacterium]